MRPKVSVIIPCYNYEDYIEQCILSVLLQKVNFNVEIIISDDNSTDYSFEIIKRLKAFYQNDQFTFIINKNQNNLGELDNTKFLLRKASGEYIAYLDADDFWTEPNKLAMQVDYLDNRPDHSMCVTGYVMLENGVYVPDASFSTFLCPGGNLSPENLCMGNSVGSSSSRLFRNYGDIIEDYFYDFSYTDWPFNFEMSLRGKIGYIGIVGYIYRRHVNSLSEKKTQIDRDNYNKRVSILKSVLNKKLYSQP